MIVLIMMIIIMPVEVVIHTSFAAPSPPAVAHQSASHQCQPTSQPTLLASQPARRLRKHNSDNHIQNNKKNASNNTRSHASRRHPAATPLTQSPANRPATHASQLASQLCQPASRLITVVRINGKALGHTALDLEPKSKNSDKHFNNEKNDTALLLITIVKNVIIVTIIMMMMMMPMVVMMTQI